MDRSDLGPEARQKLDEALQLYGVQPTYRNSRGGMTGASVEALVHALRALGAPMDGVGDIAEAREHRRDELRQHLMEPVCVVWEGSAGAVELRLFPEERDEPLDCRLETEDGEVGEWRVDPATLGVTRGEGWKQGLGLHAMSLVAHFPGDLPLGLHTLRVSTNGRGGSSRVVVAPTTAWEPEGETPGWGLFLPMHALRTRRSWGTADFRDMASLLSWTAAMGGRAVGTLPLLASFLDTPFDPSPYAPVSRLFWNELFLDVEHAPEMERSEAARTLLQSSEVQRCIAELRDAPRVDYRRAAALKRPILQALAQTSLKEGPSSDFRTFLEACPEVEQYARFRATMEEKKVQWREWDREVRESDLSDAENHFDARAEHYHLYVQWLADRQMAALAEEGRNFGAELYLDLPLGAHPDGFDVWRNRDIFVEGVSGGAPPDAFFRGGQDWGFPPLHPDRARARGHDYTIDSIRTMMRFAGTLRLDHVMSLHRLFWVPHGLGAADGVYVRYPAEELYAILCLESRRHRTVLVGEDLGTVPEEVRDAMERHALRRMHVVPFELSSEPDALAEVPARSVASLNTHDMPTFAGYWKGLDIRQRIRDGMLEPADAEEEEEQRERFRRTVTHDLVERGLLEDADEISTRSVLRALLRFLAGSATRMMLVNLEDLWLEEEPHNRPGTPGEQNWRHRSAHALEALLDLPEVVEALSEVERIRASRAAASTGGPGEMAEHFESMRPEGG